MAALYKVLRIDELSRVSETGAIERYYRHQIKTKGGVVLTVNIPEAGFNAEYVAKVLEQKATEADKILHL